MITDLAKLEALLLVLRKHGVTKFSADGISLDISVLALNVGPQVDPPTLIRGEEGSKIPNIETPTEDQFQMWSTDDYDADSHKSLPPTTPG